MASGPEPVSGQPNAQIVDLLVELELEIDHFRPPAALRATRPPNRCFPKRVVFKDRVLPAPSRSADSPAPKSMIC